ncbi:MAG TPA: hypothetical protein VHF22_09155 [Planctomycetota bacterium]|nr:hypothetical protein [Planctomycetota bacterium]
MRIAPFSPALLAAAALAVAGAGRDARAVTVDATLVRNVNPDGLLVFGIDPTTGTWYTTNGYTGDGGVGNVGSTAYKVYADEAHFASNQSSGTLTLTGASPRAGTFGFYVAASGGFLYGRDASATGATGIGAWSLSTGANAASATMTGFGGNNSTDSFVLGGFTSFNFMTDQTGTYVVAHKSTGWKVEEIAGGSNLSLTHETAIAVASGTIHYAFVIGGHLFAATGAGPYSSGTVNVAVDLETGAQTAVNFTLGGIGSGHLFLDEVLYDSRSDTLYIFNNGTQSLYKVASAAAAFGVTLPEAPSPVPEPAALGLAAAAALALTPRAGRRSGASPRGTSARGARSGRARASSRRRAA